MPRALDIPAYAGGAIEVQSGEFIRITDVEGCQIADMFAVCAADMTEWLGAAHTRGAASRLFPRVGQAFFTNRYRPMLTFVADRSPGVHDMLWRACDADLYAWAGVEGYHPSCNENFRKAAAGFGWEPQEVPDPVDWFQNTPVDAAHRLSSQPSPTQPGDHVVLRAEMDIVLIVTSCSWDLPVSLINGERCTPIRVEVGTAAEIA